MALETKTCAIKTTLGTIIATAEDECLTGAWFENQKHFPDTAAWHTQPDYPVFKILRSLLVDYFNGKNTFEPSKNSISLKPQGTVFQKAVWKILLDIPYGKLCSYGAIAKRLNSHPRVVGSAVGRNPISILIPCHRVVGSAGQLTGYAGGLDRKRALLNLEGIEIAGDCAKGVLKKIDFFKNTP